MMEAVLYDRLEDRQVRCRTCSHFCRIKDGKSGICRVRKNLSGRLMVRTGSRVVAAAVDPIEKKPLYHFLPKSRSFSIAAVGCNFRCSFCQNADIAQVLPEKGRLDSGQNTTPESLVSAAVENGCESISYTYTEPTVFFEMALETAQLASGSGLKNIFVTNGYMSRDALEKAAPFLDAANVDLKAFDDEFYRRFCGGTLSPVLETLEEMKAFNIHVEVTTLLIPGLNDDPEKLRQMAEYIAGTLGPETPWHISRFHPAFRMTDRGSTPLETLERAWQTGKDAGLAYVFVGNAPDMDKSDTECHECGEKLIVRNGYAVRDQLGKNRTCPNCRTNIPVIYE